MSLRSPIVIFVHPKASGNIGALARVLSNFDALDLRLVGNPGTDAQEDAFQDLDWALSCNGKSILENARWFPSLREALVEVHIAIGTSGREEPFEKGYERPLNDPREVFPRLQSRLEKSADANWALVLGTEDDGLSSEEAALCDQLIRIPTSTRNSSMNVAMACGVLLYHWRLIQLDAELKPARAQSETIISETAISETPKPFYDPASLAGSKSEVSGKNRWASVDEKEKWIDSLISVLDRTQFFKYPDRESVKGRLRRWLQGTEIPLGELLFAFEVLYQVEAWGTGEFKERNFLGK